MIFTPRFSSIDSYFIFYLILIVWICRIWIDRNWRHRLLTCRNLMVSILLVLFIKLSIYLLWFYIDKYWLQIFKILIRYIFCLLNSNLLFFLILNYLCCFNHSIINLKPKIYNSLIEIFQFIKLLSIIIFKISYLYNLFFKLI